MSPAAGPTFLFRQESRQRGDLGEALTVKSIVTAHIPQHFFPDFKPPSPKTPSRPLSAAGYESIL